ncbi:PREDICTED: DNA mismatch repair protein MLH3 isoform X2 [Populus euphratica]|uniref:DNA mismatch repair protein MLH3 isoform X2 n=1 Tax=Populus euphratica TaxID=75702 RepID=A0AAJ6U2Z0_POPEU|nr:PREDICTED: DNA mismatch repair protein MLH3 isoform X2 [Populus euphratica]
MGIIKRLPVSARSTMRSGILVFDLTRVVEELVFNSLDAGAKKVLVYVAVGTCYVKVSDDGCGISRDGLVLLGERYVTSKVQHLADMDVASGSFGFRGEALSSIADVSVLDVLTKARGMPNGYRKVMKGSKCLCLGIDDDIKDVGTTVVVRDLFYNQPVRRKYMQSSPKKILHLVKKCALRVALMHSEVSFKVVDIESEEELLCTNPSSAMSLLMSGFGIEDSSSLHELNISDGVLKLSGYISGPCSSFSIKAFQYVYINSRFVCKGPIHKLLNHLASRFEHPVLQKANSVSQKGKKSRPQPCPAYILNLSCPFSLYDLTFEPSKTHAEFKDWNPILAFIEKVIQPLWRECTVFGESSTRPTDTFQKNDIWQEDFFDADFSGFAIKKGGVKTHQSSRHLISCPLKMLNKEVDHLFHGKHDKVPQEFYSNVSEFKEKQVDKEFVLQGDCSSQTWNGSISGYMPRATKTDECHHLTSDKNFLLTANCFLEDSFTTRERLSDHMQRHFSSSEWQDESPKIDSMARNESLGSAFSFDHYGFRNELPFSKSNIKPILQSCSSQKSLSLDRDFFAGKEAFEFLNDGFKNKRRRLCTVENVGIPKGDTIFDIFPCALPQDNASCTQQLPADTDGAEMSAAFDLLPGAYVNSSSPNGKLLAKGKGLASNSILQLEMYASGKHSSMSDWCSVTSSAFFQAKAWEAEHFPDDNASEGSKGWGKKENCWHFPDSWEIMSKPSSQDNFFSSCTSTVLDFKNSADSSKDICKLPQWQDQNNEFSSQHSDIYVGETDWLLLDPGSKDPKRNDECERQENQLRYKACAAKERSRRSNSTPPFYRLKRRFISLNNHSMRKEEEPYTQLFHDWLTCPEANDFEHIPLQPSHVEEDLTLRTKSNGKNMPDTMPNKETPEGNPEHFQHPKAYDSSPEGFMPKDTQESMDYRIKWRNGCQQIANHSMSSNVGSQRNILDISSGFLHLAGNLLVPESIHKNCLQDARVLHQVDKKFIPIVAGGTLAVIDQHAADERIRLEELRQKVLSGEEKTVTYLDAEQELILPEIGYQLLHNYAEQVREWGWICNIEGSGTFKKNLNILHQQPTVITLLAVPCILGVNLSDGDLLEFLQQLSDTDGSSSTLPPSVLRVLNYKACRGAIMFGDSLLPSECSLIVEELKQTTLCFQCAHGRPTTIPVVNLEALQKQIAKLGVLNDGSNDLWHGLRRHELSLERAAQRLSAARG